MFLSRRGPGRLTPDQARVRTGDGTAVLLDVRELHEWEAGHAPGAVHLPLSQLQAGAALPEDAQGRQVVAVCRSGQRSQTAAQLLADRGIETVDVTGGMHAWVKAGLPVVDERGQDGRIA